MSRLQLVLGWERLLEADLTALPALQGLCRALEIRTHWDEAESTLYIESPVAGRQLALVAVPSEEHAYVLTAAQVTGMLQARLRRAGAAVPIIQNGAPLPDTNLILRIEVGASPQWGIGANYSWLQWNQNRKLAGLLVEEACKTTALPNLGTRVTLGSRGQANAPVITVQLGRPTAEAEVMLTNRAFLDSLADGLYRGLARFWADPVMEELHRTLPAGGPVPAVTELQEAESPEPVEEEDPQPATVRLLWVEEALQVPEVECEQEQEPMEVPLVAEIPVVKTEPEALAGRPQAEVELELVPVPEPEPEPEPPPPVEAQPAPTLAAEPEPEPEPEPQQAPFMEPQPILELEPATEPDSIVVFEFSAGSEPEPSPPARPTYFSQELYIPASLRPPVQEPAPELEAAPESLPEPEPDPEPERAPILAEAPAEEPVPQPAPTHPPQPSVHVSTVGSPRPARLKPFTPAPTLSGRSPVHTFQRPRPAPPLQEPTPAQPPPAEALPQPQPPAEELNQPAAVKHITPPPQRPLPKPRIIQHGSVIRIE